MKFALTFIHICSCLFQLMCLHEIASGYVKETNTARSNMSVIGAVKLAVVIVITTASWLQGQVHTQWIGNEGRKQPAFQTNYLLQLLLEI